MKKLSYSYLLIVTTVVISLITSCNNKLTVAEFLKKVSEDENYKREELIGDYKLTCVYRPSELICLSELAKGKPDYVFNDVKFKEALQNYDKAYYFDFTVGLTNGNNVLLQGVSNHNEYAARIGELTYLLGQDFYMLDGTDTIRALNCVFSNTYGNSPNAKFMFIFPKKSNTTSKEITLEYADNAFGISEKAKFKYEIELLNKDLPKIIEQKQ